MILYKDLNEIKNEEELTEYETKLNDRFGKVPKQIYELFNGMRLKWIATKLGMEQLIIKNKHIRCYFISNQQSSFYTSEAFSRIMKYVQLHKQGIYLRETEKFLVLHIEGINSMKTATHKLKEISDFVYGAPEVKEKV
jgi:transcription-repair coupling factor (superfamily II helicase)